MAKGAITKLQSTINYQPSTLTKPATCNLQPSTWRAWHALRAQPNFRGGVSHVD
jgi:hypothetical protein